MQGFYVVLLYFFVPLSFSTANAREILCCFFPLLFFVPSFDTSLSSAPVAPPDLRRFLLDHDASSLWMSYVAFLSKWPLIISLSAL